MHKQCLRRVPDDLRSDLTRGDDLAGMKNMHDR
jgi:hypothetical protein